MYDAPSTGELLQAVRRFLMETAQPKLSGQARFHARVAANVLDIVMRELEIRSSVEDEERQRLLALLQGDPSQNTAELTAALSASIRNGTIDETTPGVVEHLKSTAIN
ncbi:MAG: DUF6285 domain-containing protein, partial [Pseudomonadota bacterium]